VNIESDPKNCGFCGNACPAGLACLKGVCATCTIQNAALFAKPSISSGGTTEPYTPARANDNVLETQNCTDWAWLDGTDKPSGAWIQYDFPWAVQITSMHMDTESALVTSKCGNIGRTFGGATIQWWNGSTWVTDGLVGSMMDDWDYTMSSPVTTTRLRLYDAYATGTNGQAYNPIVFEWQVYGCN
jgi:hypothetical protein